MQQPRLAVGTRLVWLMPGRAACFTRGPGLGIWLTLATSPEAPGRRAGAQDAQPGAGPHAHRSTASDRKPGERWLFCLGRGSGESQAWVFSGFVLGVGSGFRKARLSVYPLVGWIGNSGIEPLVQSKGETTPGATPKHQSKPPTTGS